MINPTLDAYAWVLQVACSFFMTGVIAVIQLTHYPAFAQIDREKFSRFHATHSAALGLIAGTPMCIELICSLWLARRFELWSVMSLLSVLVLWIMTFFISVPAHHKLASGFDEFAWRKLLRANWVRTFVWTSRSLIFLICIFNHLRPFE